ncbi:protein BRANCHLESS TRICHOME [Oryza brachyantha]|uniref:protein BRANCHLESS TRICHOME n=1 Tax=Oryza brachyantha TaxID=4533 RepID=UPI001ADD036B|nr:protein BRANCHLESS TRICHOME [Oryza brachyantha]
MIVSLDDDGGGGGGGGMELEVEDMVEWYQCGVGSGSSATGVELMLRELRAELEVERRMRRKAEALSEVLAVELEEERRRGGAAEAECRRMRGEVGEMRAEVERALEEIDEERRMLRVAELWREERVQMKLADAKAAMEEVLREIAAAELIDAAAAVATATADDKKISSTSSSPTTSIKSSPTNHQSQATSGQLHRREVAGGENPHIARGIKGFVEFPRAVRVRPREERVDLVSNLECQRAQLRALTRHRNPPAGVGLAAAAASHSLVL